MIRTGRSIECRCHGQATVEFALVLPILVLLFCAVLHFGVLFYLQVGIEGSAREAALFGAYNPRDDQIILQVAQQSLPALVDRETVRIAVTTSGTRAQGDPLTIRVDYNIQVLKALPFGALLPIPTDVFAEVTVPIVSEIGKQI